ncbi:alpha/beta hydrolase [Marinilongibacter aquaticus]|uniref:alpha/beta hydrolase n=1 Tax=Marinilongibacter aquaticus TaxID=2975157 RepID=UPI0021BD9D4B|nr:alpha/beta hydrolase [Marinilongibacter aquaticus]UBM57580.1 alpha/beta hydrolase [Marinilongibacter aquaticus]
MKTLILALGLFWAVAAHAQDQSNRVFQNFAKGTKLLANIKYGEHEKQKLDIYWPENARPDMPLLVWFHGGAWRMGDQCNDMSYMKNTLNEILKNGFILASVDYRWSTQQVFPQIVQDCNMSLEFLYQNAEQFGFDKNRISVIGFSAGGHLVNLMALSANNQKSEFIAPSSKKSFKIKCVLDFYGPVDLISQTKPEEAFDHESPIFDLLGATAYERPDLARIASPLTYVDENDPPFFIVNGEKDESVNFTQAHLLSSSLSLVGVPNTLTIVKDAPHYGEYFDAPEIRNKLIAFLNHYGK